MEYERVRVRILSTPQIVVLLDQEHIAVVVQALETTRFILEGALMPMYLHNCFRGIPAVGEEVYPQYYKKGERFILIF